MTTVVDPLRHDLAVIAAVGSITTSVGGVATQVPVGFAAAPVGALKGVQAETGPDYVICYPISSTRDGTLGDPFADGELVYQFTCVARSAAGARWLVAKIEAALVTVAIPGRAAVLVIPEDGGAVRPDFDVDPPVFIATPRMRLLTTPA